MDKVTFEKVIAETLDSLPEEFRSQMHNVEVTVEDEPTEEQKVKLKLSINSSLFGLFEGVPQNVPGQDRAYLPDKITIFRLPMLERYSSEDEIRGQINSTVLHEIGHFFGMSEGQLRKKRKKL